MTGVLRRTLGRRRQPPPQIPADALAFHRENLVLDLHVDTLLWSRLLGYDIGARHRNRLPTSPVGFHMDLPRAREGGLDAAVLGLVVNPRRVRRELLGSLKLMARWERDRGLDQTLGTISLLARAAERHPDELCFARSGSELKAAVSAGRFGALVGLEGSHGIEADLDNVAVAYERGLRLIGLVHFQATEAGFPMTVEAFDGRGLTPFGLDLIAEMERLGMVVDLAHLNGRGIEDALAHMTRPFVVSHTACAAVHDTRRNTSDDQIRRVADRGGVIGIAVGRGFLGRPGLEGFVAHIEHALHVGGADCVALGTDYDGAIVPAEGMDDVTSLPRVTAALLARGHDPEIVGKVLGRNALRVLTEVCG